jgi:hypothetical protein
MVDSDWLILFMKNIWIMNLMNKIGVENRCPHKNCKKKFQDYEFFEHLKTTCGLPKASPTVNIESRIKRRERLQV